MAGNRRYLRHKEQHPDQSLARRKQLTAGQHPFAVILGCADSLVARELLFDQGLGDVFDIGVAGNIVDDAALGSIEYAADKHGLKSLPGAWTRLNLFQFAAGGPAQLRAGAPQVMRRDASDTGSRGISLEQLPNNLLTDTNVCWLKGTPRGIAIFSFSPGEPPVLPLFPLSGVDWLPACH